MKNLLILASLICSSLCVSAKLVNANFDDLSGVTFNSTTAELYKVAGTAWDNGSAFSENLLEAKDTGSIEYVCETLTDEKLFGMTSATKHGGGMASIDYGYYISSSSLYIVNAGKIKLRLGRVKVGTKIRMDISKSDVKFFMNGKQVYVLSIVSQPYRLGAVIYNKKGKFVGIKTDFKLPPPPPPPPSEEEFKQYTELAFLPSSYVKDAPGEFCFSFKYRKLGESDEMSFAVYNNNHYNRASEVNIGSLSLNHGINKFCANVSGIPPGVYTLEVTLPNGEKLYAKFRNTDGEYDEAESTFQTSD